MSKSDKTMFYYLGLSLLLLIVLGVFFGVSSVKESFGRGGWWSKVKACMNNGGTRKECVNRYIRYHPDPKRRGPSEAEDAPTEDAPTGGGLLSVAGLDADTDASSP